MCSCGFRTQTPGDVFSPLSAGGQEFGGLAHVDSVLFLSAGRVFVLLMAGGR